ncbi:MAG: hypothetical protein GY906_29375, partial [bacterium]|nr:hypothetical protein [bacterium]
YRTCPAEFADSTVQTTWPALPDSISAEVERVAPDSPEQGVSLGLAITQNAIAYDRSVEVATAYQQAREQGEPLFSCAERLGVGDCDVQNAILAAVLGEFGIPARMAVGYVGSGGHVLSGLHAWVEYLDSTGRWRIADASLRRARDVAAVAPESKGTIREVMTATEGLFGELPVVPAVGVVSVTLLISFALVVRLQRDRNTSMELGEIGRAQLLEGVLERPEAFNTIAALHSEPLVPVVRGKDISLKKVERLSRAGRLYCGRRGSLLVDKAVRRGLKVLDLDSDEARLVAEHFAAQDLERWQGFIDESAEVAPCRLLNSVLGQFGERWKTRVTSNGDQQIIVIAGAKLGVVRDLGSPLVLVSSDSELGRSVQEMAHSSPGAAALILAQALVPLQIKNTRIAGRVMAEIARMVLVEGSA